MPGKVAKRITLKERVADYITRFGSITSLEAFRDLGVTRLSAIIYQLRKERVVLDKEVTSKNRYGDYVHYKKYYFGE